METDNEKGGNDTADLLSTLRKPSSISIHFAVKNKGSIDINSKLSLYVRIIPTDDEYKDGIKNIYGNETGLNSDIQSVIDNEITEDTIEHPLIWKRLDLSLPKITVNISELKNNNEHEEIINLRNNVLKEISEKEMYISTSRDLPIELLKSGNIGSYRGFWDKIQKNIAEINLDWKVKLVISDEGIFPGFEKENIHLINVSLVNCTDFSATKDFKSKELFDPVIFNPNISIDFHKVVVEEIKNSWKYDLPYSRIVTEGDLPPSFDIKYNTYVWGTGCFPEYIKESNRIVTKITNIQQLKRDRPFDASDLECLRFHLLADKNDKIIIANLEKIIDYLDDFKKSYEDEFTDKNLDVKQFKLIFNRFKSGADLIKSDKKILSAFRLMNKTYEFAYGTDKKEEGWRLFQIVFIIGNIHRLVREKKQDSINDDAELLYVATGGGKTESYVGLTITLLFYQRLMKQEFGIGSWVKFPLRLLALDQFDRLTNIIIWANFVKNEYSIRGDPFSLGFFVGNDDLYPATVAEWVYEKMGDPSKNELLFKRNDGYKFAQGGLLSECPICKKNKDIIQLKNKGEVVEIAGDYRWRYDSNKHRVIHWCEKCHNEFYLYVTDEEIYRYLPSVLVSTVDKIATAAWTPFFSGLLGAQLFKCKNHGYSITPKNCSIMDVRCGNKKSSSFGSSNAFHSFQKRGQPFDKNKPFSNFKCDNDLIKINNNGNHAPVFMIQDELHLLKENLGTIDSYFESLIDTIIYKNSSHHVNYIAMSATLAGTRKQVGLLYLRGTTLWPGEAPIINPLDRPKSDAFFKHLDSVHRTYIGMMPHGKTPDYASYRSVQYCWMLLHDILNDISLIKDEPVINKIINQYSEYKVKEFIKSYYTKNFVYQNRKIGTHNFASSIDKIVNDDLSKFENKYPNITCDAVTGDNSMDEIRNYRRKMTIDGDLDSLIATSLISHGVDISNVNQMFFQGMPDSTAEFIQASSRIGRKFPGAVFVSFYPSRSRDLQLSSSFEMYIQTLKFWVESVPISRWSKDALKEVFATTICFVLCSYGQQLLKSCEKIDRRWPITIYQLGNPSENTAGYLYWREAIDSLDRDLKSLLKEGLGIAPSDFVKKQTPPDLLPKNVLYILENYFDLLFDRFNIELVNKFRGSVPKYYVNGQLAFFLKRVMGSKQHENGDRNDDFVASWLNCMTGLRGIQEPVVILPTKNSMAYLEGGNENE